MAQLLDKSAVEALAAPAKGNRITYDTELKGFGVRVTSGGAKAFILNYRAGGRERRLTIGSYPDWKVTAARKHAEGLKRSIDVGADPMLDRHLDRRAPTIDQLADRFVTEHLIKRRPSTQVDYKGIIKRHIRPELGKIKVAELRHEHIERLHNRILKTAPFRANRTVAVLSKMLSLAIRWEMRSDNPAKGIEKAPEQKRERFLSPTEIGALGTALADVKEEASANALRLLLLSGARKSEVLKARWSEFDLAKGVWVKPSAHMKNKKDHRVPLNSAARLLLSTMRADADELEKKGGTVIFLFPGDEDTRCLTDIKRTWISVCQKAGLGEWQAKTDSAEKPLKDQSGAAAMVWRNDTRVHDLRHTFASILASSGLSLPVIGQLLGHTQAATTLRYAHLLDDPLRAATEQVGKVVTAANRKKRKSTLVETPKT